MRRFAVGDFDITVAIHGRGSGSPRWLFPDIEPEELTAALAPHVNADGDVDFVFSSLIVRAGDRVVLVDAGPAPAGGAGGPSVLEALHAAGLTADRVEVVVVSHGHDDHVGGLVSGGPEERRLTFPGADHVVDVAEFDHWVSAGAGEVGGRNLAHLADAGLLRLIDGEREIVPGLTVVPAPGHTPGHLAVMLSSQGEAALYVGDALAHQVNVARPDWNHFSDMLAADAVHSRRALVERAAAGGHLVLGSHIPVAGRVRGTRGGQRRFVSDDPLAAAEALEVAR